MQGIRKPRHTTTGHRLRQTGSTTRGKTTKKSPATASTVRGWVIVGKDDHMNEASRFDAKTVRDGECLLWTGAQNGLGYAQIRIGGKKVVVHRYAYERHYGPIPDGALIDHICHTRSCVEPTHLRLATNKQNLENLAGAYSTSATGIRGVYAVKGSNTFRAQVTHNRRKYNAGRFATIAEAEQAVVSLRNRLFTHNDADRAA